MPGEIPSSPEIETPKVLYHASPKTDLVEFEARREGFRDADEGPVVFATPDKVYATMFLVKTNDSWTAKGRYSEAGVMGPWHIIISDREEFEKADTGGSIYTFDTNDFTFDPNRNMGAIEWTSRKSVKPIGKKEDYSSGLEAMKAAGVEVYFVDRQTFKAINTSDDHGQSIIASLIPEA